jgi:hypothetical protein
VTAAATLLAILVFVGTPFLMIGHDHGDHSADKYCAICVLASVACSPGASHNSPTHDIVITGHTGSGNDTILVHHTPAHISVRAPPGA